MVDLYPRGTRFCDHFRKIDIVQQDPSPAHQTMNLQDVEQRPGMLMIPIDESERQTSPLDKLRAVGRILERMDRDEIANFWRYQIDRESYRLARIDRILGFLVDCMHDGPGRGATLLLQSQRDHFRKDRGRKAGSRSDFDHERGPQNARHSSGEKEVRGGQHAKSETARSCRAFEEFDLTGSGPCFGNAKRRRKPTVFT